MTSRNDFDDLLIASVGAEGKTIEPKPIHNSESLESLRMSAWLFAFAYSLFGFLAFILIEPTSGVSLIVAFAIFAGAIPVIAAWTVFGPESYWKRFLTALMPGVLIGAGGLLAIIILIPEDGPNPFHGILATLLLIAPVSLTAQLPFWFFRIFFGWQFTSPHTPPRVSYHLKDLFLLTFLAALAVSSPAMMTNLDWIFNPGSYRGESLVLEGSMSQPSADAPTMRVPAPYEQFDFEQYQTSLALIGWGLFVFCVAIFIGSLLSVFVVYAATKPGNLSSACVLAGSYATILFLVLLGIPAILTGGGSNGGPDWVIGTISFVLLTVAVTFLPLSLLRRKNWALTSTKRPQPIVAVKAEMNKKND